MFGWIFKKATGGVIEAVGNAVNKNIRTLKGDKAEAEAAVHDEQMATLAEHAAEFAARPEATWFDSLADGLNRLPRPLFVLWVFFLFLWPFFDVSGFVGYMRAMELVPETIWTLVITLIAFYFGGRVISQDLKKPKLTPEQKKLALEIIKEREQAIIEARTPLIVEVAPTRKPPPPPWACEPLATPPPPPIKTEPDAPPVKGRSPEVEAMIWDLIEREGGYVNDPKDSGGPTKYGVTWKTLSAWREMDCGEEEVKAMSKEDAFDIYLKEYYFGPSIDSLPIGLQAHVFDCGVNAGPRKAIRLLQEALNRLGAGIREDGVIGPMTREACNSYPLADIHTALVDIRKSFYRKLADQEPKNKRFLAGWLDRADLFAA